MNFEVLKLPWDLQAALAIGYAAYIVANRGLRGRQSTIDVAFISLIFSVIATMVLAAAAPRLGTVLAIALAFLTSVAVGAMWRWRGREWLSRAFMWSNLSWSNDELSALVTLSANNKHPVSQVSVLLDDDTWLCCDRTVQFTDAPFGPLLIGADGDVALYVTSERYADGTTKEQSTVQDTRLGDCMTYVPAARIRRILLRHVSAASRSSPAEAGTTVPEKADSSA
jgi:hypothetical protein